MALADPQSLVVDSSTYTLGRAINGSDAGRFVAADGSYAIDVLPRVSKRGRTLRQVSVRNTKITADPLVSSTNVRVNDTVRLLIDRPLNGYSDDEVLKQVKGFIAWLSASSDANLKKIIAGEN